MSNTIKNLKKLEYADLRHLITCLNANKILLNIKKTEIMIFKSKRKKFKGELKRRLYGKRLYIPQKISNTWESQLTQILFGYVKLMTFPSN